MNGQKKIYSIAGLKVIAIWLIFWWHSWLNNPPCDLGARCCEFFFVASGFLVYYAHRGERMRCTWKESAYYVKKKLVNIWPMHFFAFCLCLCSMSFADIFTRSTGIRALINLLLLQSWINIEQIFFSFNGPSWFLSSLLFCYFVTPVMLRLIQKKRRIWIFFPMVFLIRYAIEEIEFYYPNVYWNFNIHVSPILRMMEFFLGMMTGSVWDSLNERYVRPMKSKRRFLVFGGASLAEIMVLFLTGVCFVAKQNQWGRAVFSLWFCMVVLIFAFDGGILSRIMATRFFVWFASIQFEFFIFHIPVINLMAKYVEPYGFSGRRLAVMSFAIVIVLAWGYRFALKKPAEAVMRRLLDRGWDCLVS